MSSYQRCLLRIDFEVLWSRSWKEEHQEQSCCPPLVRCPRPWRKNWGMFQRNPENITDETDRLSTRSGLDWNIFHGNQGLLSHLCVLQVLQLTDNIHISFTLHVFIALLSGLLGSLDQASVDQDPLHEGGRGEEDGEENYWDDWNIRRSVATLEQGGLELT